MEDGFDCGQVPGWMDGKCCRVCHSKKMAYVFKITGKSKQFKICCKFALHFATTLVGEAVEIDDSAMDAVTA